MILVKVLAMRIEALIILERDGGPNILATRSHVLSQATHFFRLDMLFTNLFRNLGRIRAEVPEKYLL